MSHETTATRKFVSAEVAEHAADAVSHVTAQERARWDALAAGADGKSVYVKSFTPSAEAGGTSVLVLHDERTDEDVEVRVLNGADGAPGAPLTWADLTAEQKASLKGDPGPVNWGDLTAEQKAELKDELRFKYSDFTPAQLAALKGAKGDPGETGAPGPAGESFTYSMFSQEQLAALKGPKGDTGDTGPAFVFAKTYASVAAMTADFSGTDTEEGDHVLVSTSGADNAKVYRKGASAWEFVVQLAGPQGPAGPQGQAGSPGSPGRDGEDGEDGARGSQIFGGSGTFTAASVDGYAGAGTISTVVAGGDVNPGSVQVEDWYFAADGKTYRCVASAADVPDPGVPLWKYVGSIRGPVGPAGSFVPQSGASTPVNMASRFVEFSSSGQLVFPLPEVPSGQLLEYVLYVKAPDSGTVSVGETAFQALEEAGYTWYSNNGYVLDDLPAGYVAAYTLAQMGSSRYVMVMRALLTEGSLLLPGDSDSGSSSVAEL